MALLITKNGKLTCVILISRLFTNVQKGYVVDMDNCRHVIEEMDYYMVMISICSVIFLAAYIYTVMGNEI